jgi:hypothetical protein
MRGTVVVSLSLLAVSAWARPWNGIEPGVSTREEVTKKFGEPTKVVSAEGKDVLAYLGPNAIRGTQQAQFKVNPTSQIVERIDVFPGPVIDREAIENTYGHACAAGPAATNPCYVKKVDERFRTYFQYLKVGLVIFFNDDGKTVESFVFTSPKKDAAPTTGTKH